MSLELSTIDSFIYCDPILEGPLSEVSLKLYYITSGKNFIKITSVGMGAAKSNETR